MLGFIKHVLNESNISERTEPTKTSITTYHFRSKDEDIHVNFNLIIDDTYFQLTEEDENQLQAFRSKQILSEKLEHFESNINKAVRLYIAKAESTKGNQEGSIFRLTSDLKLEEV